MISMNRLTTFVGNDYLWDNYRGGVKWFWPGENPQERVVFHPWSTLVYEPTLSWTQQHPVEQPRWPERLVWHASPRGVEKARCYQDCSCSRECKALDLVARGG